MNKSIYLIMIVAIAIGFMPRLMQAETGREVIMNLRVQDFTWDTQYNMYRSTIRLNSQDSVYYIKSEKYAKDANELPTHIKEYVYGYENGLQVSEKRYYDKTLKWEINLEYDDNGIIQRRDTIEHLVGHKISLRSEIYDYADDYYTIRRQKQYYMVDGKLQDEVKNFQELLYNYFDELIYENNWTYDNALQTVRNHVITEEIENNFYSVKTYEYEKNLFEPIDSTFNLKRFDDNYRLIENYSIRTDAQLGDTVIQTKYFYTYNDNGDMLSRITYVPYLREETGGEQILYQYDTSAAEIYDFDVPDYDYMRKSYNSFAGKDENDLPRRVTYLVRTYFYRDREEIVDSDTMNYNYIVHLVPENIKDKAKQIFFDNWSINGVPYYNNKTEVEQASQDTITDRNLLDLKLQKNENTLELSGPVHQQQYKFSHGQLIEEYLYVCDVDIKYENNILVHQKSRVYNQQSQEYEWTHSLENSYHIKLRENSAEEKLIHHINTKIDNRINASAIHYLNREYENDRPILDTLVSETNSPSDLTKVLVTIDYEYSDLDDISGVHESAEIPQYSIYPNPASDFITIKNFLSQTEISALDILGRSYSLRALNAGSDLMLDISKLSRGLYFININGQLIKFIKE